MTMQMVLDLDLEMIHDLVEPDDDELVDLDYDLLSIDLDRLYDMWMDGCAEGQPN